MPTIGSLCTGIGGLDLAVERHFGASLLWYSDIDPKANEVMAVRRPGIPNLLDFKSVDASTLVAPDIVCFGWPCQTISTGGLQTATADDRWLFDHALDFIERLNEPPAYLVMENVNALFTVDQGRTGRHVVDSVVDLGYRIDWGMVQAAHAGLPHHRRRFFAVASHPDRSGGEAWSHSRPDGRPLRVEPLGPSPCPARWGVYARAIAHAEGVLGRPAPEPVDDKGRLSPVFVEWALGFEPGWVTDLITARTHALRLLGNSVCPPQAELALALLT